MLDVARRGMWLAGLLLAGCATPAQPITGWARLNPYQGALSADEWRAALNGRFAPNGAGQGLVEVTPDGAALAVRMDAEKTPAFFYLQTRSPAAPRPTPPPGARYWRLLGELGPATPERPLAGLRVALDPGHLGGAWGKMEGRSFSFNGDPPVQEGDLALRVAQLLQPRLEALGAQVSFVRDRPGPLTGEKIEEVHPANWAAMEAFLNREIHARAVRVNEVLQPDLVLCLHLDAVDWPDPQNPALVDRPQHFHIMVNGSYEPAEVANEEQRLAMVERIASGAGEEELAVARAMAEGAAPIFGQPASGYSSPVGIALGGNGYVWGRNVLADRLYRCPVIFLEPYVANSVEGYARIQAGEYEGTRDFNGVARKNIFVEYGDAVVAGLVKYYGERPSGGDAAGAAR
jgi:N-acetylmuramoyl-L-alanine amidase